MIAKSGIDLKKVEALALSTQGSVWDPLDKDGVLIRPFMGWQDTRGAAYVDRIMAGEYIDPAELYQIAGYGPATVPALTKYLWFKDNEPELYAKTEYFSSHQDYFLQRFGADDWFVADTATASRTGVFDIDNNCWSEKIIVGALGLDIKKFPRVVKAVTCVGSIKPDIAEKTGLAVGTGVYRDYEEAAQKAVHIKEGYQPNPDNYAAYNEGYRRFVTAYESLSGGGYFALNKEI